MVAAQQPAESSTHDDVAGGRLVVRSWRVQLVAETLVGALLEIVGTVLGKAALEVRVAEEDESVETFRFHADLRTIHTALGGAFEVNTRLRRQFIVKEPRGHFLPEAKLCSNC